MFSIRTISSFSNPDRVCGYCIWSDSHAAAYSDNWYINKVSIIWDTGRASARIKKLSIAR